MKTIWAILVKAANWIMDLIFNALISLSGEDDEDEGWVSYTEKKAVCYLCGHEAPGHHPNGELIVCDDCRQKS